jgi:uncharacterized protein (DUF58 family)
MISPRNPLLAASAILLLPLALVAAAMPAATGVCVALAAIFAWVAFLDAVAGRRRLGEIGAELPERIRCSKDRPAELPLVVRFGKRFGGTLRLGLSFPADFETVETRTIACAGEPAYSVPWSFTPHRRGAYRFARLHYEVASPLGFWALRGTCPLDTEIRVYPNVLHDRRKLAGLFLDRSEQGAHAQRLRGKGREFEQLREYQPGDNYEDIHWKATARRGEPVTKTFQVERTQEVYVVVDASRLSARAARNAAGHTETQLERFLSAALVLGQVAERQGDLYGIATFSDRMHGFVRARRGHAHYNACRELLYGLDARAVSPDYEEAVSFLAQRLRRRALLVFLTSLDDPVLAESFVSNIELVKRDHLVLANMVTLPHVRPLFSDPEVGSLDEIYAHLAGHLQWHDLRETQRILHRRGVSLGLVDSAALSTELVAQYLHVKQAQML